MKRTFLITVSALCILLPWQADSKTNLLAYIVSLEGPGSSLMIQDLNQGDAQEILRGWGIGLPTWSPDGSQMGLIKQEIISETEWVNNLYIGDGNGSNMEKVSTIPNPKDFWPFELRWSPDGTKFALTAMDIASGVLFTINKSDVMNDGGEIPRTAIHRKTAIAGWGISWAPDSKRIVFVSGQWFDTNGFKIINTETNLVEREVIIGTKARSVAYPAWSPDGTQIVFKGDPTKETNHGYALYTMRPDGSELTNITTPEKGWGSDTSGSKFLRIESRPMWSEDSKVVILASIDGKRGFYALDPCMVEEPRLVLEEGKDEWLLYGSLLGSLPETVQEVTVEFPKGGHIIDIPPEVNFGTISGLWDTLGGTQNVHWLASFDSQRQRWLVFLGDFSRGYPADRNINSDTQIIAAMKQSVTLTVSVGSDIASAPPIVGIRRDTIPTELSDLVRITFAVPRETVLGQNYPNPFNPETWIPYEIAKACDVSIEIYDTSGRIVRSFTLGFQPAGKYVSRNRAIYWNGRNDFGETVASGIYFYKLSTDHFSKIRKMEIRK